MRKQIKRFLIFGLLALNGLPGRVLGKNVTLVDADGQSSEVYIDASDKFTDVMEWIEQYYKISSASFPDSTEVICENDLTLTFVVSNHDVVVRKKGVARNYNAPVTKQEKKDIAYIVNTLAKDSLVSLASSKSSLKRAGDRIEHVHPLRFLMIIFTDEELKAGIHAIRGRTSWVWDEFISGIVTSLKDEAAKQNLKTEFVHDFAQQVNINPSLILPSIQGARWKEFVNILIDTIPRANDPNRYNM